MLRHLENVGFLKRKVHTCSVENSNRRRMKGGRVPSPPCVFGGTARAASVVVCNGAGSGSGVPPFQRVGDLLPRAPPQRCDPAPGLHTPLRSCDGTQGPEGPQVTAPAAAGRTGWRGGWQGGAGGTPAAPQSRAGTWVACERICGLGTGRRAPQSPDRCRGDGGGVGVAGGSVIRDAVR